MRNKIRKILSLVLIMIMLTAFVPLGAEGFATKAYAVNAADVINNSELKSDSIPESSQEITYNFWANSMRCTDYSCSQSQTVTVEMNSTDTILGYYWGTNSDYLKNTFYSTDSDSVSQTVTDAGTYYFTAKGTGGVSETEDITFYKTEFITDEGSVSPEYTISKKNYTITVPAPVNDGHKFIEWNTSPDGTGLPVTSAFTPDEKIHTLYAIWKHTVKYDAGDGSVTPADEKVYDGDAVTLPTPTRNGYTCIGWKTNTLSETIYPCGSRYIPTGTETFYAVWEKNDTYIVTYNANGGSVTPSDITVEKGKSVTLPTPVRSGYICLGWSESSSAASAGYLCRTNYTPESDVILYAVWKYNDITKPIGTINCTNDVAPSQTVTLTLKDDAGIEGYYWGKDSTYYMMSGESYTYSGNTIVITKTVAEPGLYHFKIKDINGNLSDDYTVSFYRTTLNANGGSVSPTSVLTKSGNSFTFPTPTGKSGYTYSGWSTSSTATSCVTTLKPTTDTTYYAVWEIVPQSFNQSNRFSFSNSSSNFVTSWSGGIYYMTQSDYNKLTSYIKKYDGAPSATISNVQDMMYGKWGGSCYGMASAAVLDYQNKIAFNENFGNGAKTMWDVKSPSTDKNIMSAVNYYMVSQKIGFVRNSSSYYDKNYYPSSWTPGLKKLVSTAQKGEPFLFCYYWVDAKGSSCGHAIVAYDCKTNSDGSFSITAYDNRYPNKDIIIKVNSGCTSCVVNGNENAVAFEIYNDMSAFDKIDIDGPNNDMNVSFNSYSYSGANDEISVVANSDVTVTNADGETISIINGDISGTMDILSVHMTVRDTADGEAAPVEFVFEVGHSKTYMFESTDDEMEVSVKTKDAYGSASSENADCIAIGDDGVYVIGNDMEYSTALSSKDTSYDTVILSGEAKQDVSLTYSGNSILISGVNGKDETISIFAHDEMEPEDYEIKEGYEQVKVTAENDGIDIMGSSNNDGRFDVSVVKKDGINSVSIDDIEVKYKTAAKIVPQIDIADGTEYTVKYESSDPSVATVDKDGNITMFGKGEARITCTVTDEYGNTLTDTCTVTVKFQWWQWLIWILLFGFLWY